MPFCPSCGEPVELGDAFCGSCGAKLKHRPGQDGQAAPPPAVSGGEQAVGGTPDTEAPPAEVPPAEAPPPAPPSAAPPPLRPQPQSRPATPRAQPPRRPARQPRRAANTRRLGGKGGLTFMGVLLALAWLAYSSGFLGALAGSYSMNPERFVQQADWISFGLMLGLPLAISALRPVLDVLLVPLQPVRFLLPARMLVGMGLVAPFAVAWFLYNVNGFRNYEFLHMSLIVGTLVSYAILRTPARYSA